MKKRLYEHFITPKQNTDTYISVDVPEWIAKDNLSSFVADHSFHYKGYFGSEELIKYANEYAKLHWDTMSDEDKRNHEKGLEFINNSNFDEFSFCTFRLHPDHYDGMGIYN